MKRQPQSNARTWRLLTLAGLTSAAAGAGLAVLFLSPPVPASLAEADGDIVELVQETYDDTRQVSVVFGLQPASQVRVSIGGTVTATNCETDRAFNSGEVVAQVNGRNVVALHTTTPFWRSLTGGERGEDVSAVQIALQSLGYSVEPTGVFDRQTRLALQPFLRDRGVSSDYGHFNLEDFAWMPAPVLTAAACPVRTGDTISPAAPVLESSQLISSISVDPMPGDLVPGARTLTVGSTLLRVDDVGRVVEIDSVAIGSDSAVLQHIASSGTEPMPAQLTLSEPLNVLSLPSAGVGMSAGQSCISNGEEVIEVQVVASRLGSTLIAQDEDVLESAFVPVREAGTPCK